MQSFGCRQFFVVGKISRSRLRIVEATLPRHSTGAQIMAKGTSNGSGKSSMNAAAAARIQSSTAKSGNGKVSSDSFAARAQSAAATNGGSSKA
jgi:hypothetical protein